MTKVIFYDNVSNTTVDTSKHFTFSTVAEMNNTIKRGIVPLGSIIFVDENEIMQNVQIVDLSSYGKKTDINTALNTKLDKNSFSIISKMI
jgi:hypothetical protein